MMFKKAENIRYYRYMLRESMIPFLAGVLFLLFSILSLIADNSGSVWLCLMILLALLGGGAVAASVRIFFTVYAVNRDGLIIRGLFKTRLIRWPEVIDFELLPDADTGGLFLYLENAEWVTVSYQLKGFYDFLKEVANVYKPLGERDISKPRRLPAMEAARHELSRTTCRQERIVAFIAVFGILAFYGYFFVFKSVFIN